MAMIKTKIHPSKQLTIKTAILQRLLSTLEIVKLKHWTRGQKNPLKKKLWCDMSQALEFNGCVCMQCTSTWVHHAMRIMTLMQALVQSRQILAKQRAESAVHSTSVALQWRILVSFTENRIKNVLKKTKCKNGIMMQVLLCAVYKHLSAPCHESNNNNASIG